MKFFVWLNEQQQGPFDDETIQKMVLDGQITHETLLCLEGGDLDWTPAKELFPPDSPHKSPAVEPHGSFRPGRASSAKKNSPQPEVAGRVV